MSGWNESADAWLTEIGDDGDFSRQFVLDAPMLARVRGRGFRTALDVGCGEGRFCRMLQAAGVATVGIDPTLAFIERARALDPGGDYRPATAETLDVPPESFDLVVSYLSLIDIPDLATATAKMERALRPGGLCELARHPHSELAPPAEHVHAALPRARPHPAVFRRAGPVGRRPRQGRALSARSLLPDHGVVESGVGVHRLHGRATRWNGVLILSVAKAPD
jgi:SAM-dependent methyltransferase